MFNSRVVIYLLIISYLVNLGHNLIPHHHHHEDQINATHIHHHHHLPAEDEDKDDRDVILLIFGNILHHDDDGLIVIASSDNEITTDSSENAFGLNEISIFENMLWTIKSKHPPEYKSYHKLQIHYCHGLRAPPVA